MTSLSIPPDFLWPPRTIPENMKKINGLKKKVTLSKEGSI